MLWRMARYVPSALLQIAKPCSENWEAMAGGSRVRHCASCGRNVINVASLTPEQIEKHIEAARHGTPMPCMRLVRFEDGALLTARTDRQLSLRQRAIATLSALTIAATTAVAQQAPSAGDATLTGRITDRTGTGIPGAFVKLQQPNHTDIVVKTSGDGTFNVKAIPGEYALSADALGFQHLPAQRVILAKGPQNLPQPLKLDVAALMGQVVVVTNGPEPLKTESSKDERRLAPADSPQYSTPGRR
jgi:hypothetical protein